MMALRHRLLLAVAIIAPLGSAIAWLAGGETSPAIASVHWESAAQCRQCHADVDAEWAQSHHRIAYTNPEVQKLSDDFRKEECMDCHLPRPLAITGFGKRTLPRRTNFDEGVSCISCHLGQDGSTRRGRSHLWRGAHDATTLRSAGVFTVERRGEDLLLRLQNRGAGHNFPTEERHRAVDLLVRFVDRSGKAGEWTRAFRCRQPYRDEPGEDTQLPSGATREVTVPIPAGSVRAEARLWYRLTPFCGDDEPLSTLLEERAVELR